MHKKELHIDTVATCEQFLSGKCLKTHDECWYKHPTIISKSSSEQEVFSKAQEDPFPPDQLKTFVKKWKM